MDERTKNRLKGFFSGVGLCTFLWMISYGLVCLLFSELKNHNLALYAVGFSSFIFDILYLYLEKHVFSKIGTSSFAIGYFGMSVLMCAAVFFITNIFDLSLIFDCGVYNAVCIRQCAFIIKLGGETFKYIKDVFKEDN